MPMQIHEDIYQPLVFDAIRIGLASPEKILSWSHGEVKKPETINYRTLKPERDGLFCERIFGPSRDWECHCGKFKKKPRLKGTVCDRCGVEVTKSSVRRERMGHISLASPVSHIWYFKGIPSRIATILKISARSLEDVLYFASYIVLDPGNTNLKVAEVITDAKYRETIALEGIGSFRAGMGAEAVEELLKKVDLEKEYTDLRAEYEGASAQKRAKIMKQLEVVEAFRNSGNRPEWMILNVLPVIPPDLRPMVQLDGGRFATSDLNDLYRRIINRNNRLGKMDGAPEIIVRNEKRMLQEAVDSLIDNGRRGRAVTGAGNRSLKSLSSMLKGKQGRFRQNLLGKRVDYSGRSVIVVGPDLKIFQCGLPKEMAIELFKPFVMKELISLGKANNVKNAKKMVDRAQSEVFDVLEDIIKEHPVMLNRAPTLHRLGIQAFEPILVEGKAIRLHPLVCTAFNADFDGDQMAVHLPLSVEAQAECRFLLLSPNNLLKPSDGGPVAVPSQDMVLGIYYLTQERPEALGTGRVFRSVNEAILAYDNRQVDLHAKVGVRCQGKDAQGRPIQRLVYSTVGRFIFNEIIDQDLGFVDRTIPGNELELEIDFHVVKKDLKKILEKVIEVHGTTKTAEVLDNIKAIGNKYSTRAAMTVSISDMTVPSSKNDILRETQETVDDINLRFRYGEYTEEERYKGVIETWGKADERLTRELMDGLDRYNNIFMMADSGARGSEKQIKQLAGMRGMMQDTSGRTIELPIKSNLREGLDVLEYFISAHGARKGLSDTALRTADSGYLTRRLVDVSQDVIIQEEDCAKNGVIPFMEISAFTNNTEEDVVESLQERITGRTAAEDIVDPESGEIIVPKNELIYPLKAAAVARTGVKSVKIRNVLACRCKGGICSKCYGSNMASGEPVQIGEAVGIIAAQSIGEPGTQLTMRTFHTGGVAGVEDITGGLPRVEEIFEARKPKGVAIISDIAGEVFIKEDGERREVIVTDTDTGVSKTYLIPYNMRIKSNLSNGDFLNAGDAITDGSVNPHDLLRIKGDRAAQDYMLREVQKVYRMVGEDINDKHLEVIVRQMMKRVRIEEAGDSDVLVGTTMDYLDYLDMNDALLAEEKAPMEGKRVMLGITKASLATDSFLSAASFQETTKVLTEAAINGRKDNLRGLKENVLIGKLIPAGTGMKRYQNVALTSDYEEPENSPITAAEAYKNGLN